MLFREGSDVVNGSPAGRLDHWLWNIPCSTPCIINVKATDFHFPVSMSIYNDPYYPDDVRHLLDPDDVPVSMNIARIQSHPSDVDALHDIGAFCVSPVSDADENDTPDDDANEGGCSPSDDQ